MIDEIFNKPHVQRRLRHGPLATTFAAYVDHLQGRGYGQFTIQQYVQAVEHFEAWMTRRGNVVADVKPGLVMKFLVRHLPRCRCRQLRQRAVPTARAALRQLLIVVTLAQASQPPMAALSMTPVDGVISAFDKHLAQTCGLAPATRRSYRREVHALLVARFGHGAVDLAALRSSDIRDFVTARGIGGRRGTSDATARLCGSGRDEQASRCSDHQMLLNAYLESSAQPNRLNVSGSMDAATISTIREFQRRVVNLPEPDGRVDPHGPTLRKLLNRPRAGGRRPLPSFQTSVKELSDNPTSL